MSTEYQFHPLGINDLTEMMAIERSSYTEPWSASMMRDSLLSAHSRVWGIFITDSETKLKIIGFGVITVIFDEAEILSMTIDDGYHRKGYGRRLLNFLIRKAKKGGADNIFLEVRISNIGAISLYKSAGFEEISLRKKYYKLNNGQYEDAYIFKLDAKDN
ncbi:MAG: ribosomal-protein-alanine N-acetyltransferase [Francisellaceae bacterium]|jgi:ribosomal-protein-alanine N-acetyltransferase